MKKKNLLFLFLYLICIISSFAQSYNKKSIDKGIKQYLKQGKSISASNLMVKYANYLLDHGDTVQSLEYQLKNIQLTEDNLDYFYRNGLTDYGYFSNYYVAISQASWLKKSDVAIPLFVSTIEKMSDTYPEMLPLFGRDLSYILWPLQDSSYENAIYSLQYVLDYIASQEATDEYVDLFLEIFETMCTDRLLNSLQGNILINSRYDEVESMYYRNKKYISGLSSKLFPQSSGIYDSIFVRTLKDFTSSFAAQKRDTSNAIRLLYKGISILNSIEYPSPGISQMIAGLYADLAYIYFEIGDMGSFISCCNYAVPYLKRHNNDLDYCNILQSLACSFYYCRNYEIASNLAEECIMERMLMHQWEPSYSDIGLLSMYTIPFDPNKVITVYKNFQCTGRPFSGYYLQFADAFSMLSNTNKDYADSALHYFELAKMHLDSDHDDSFENQNYKNDNLNYYTSLANHFQGVGKLEEAYLNSLKTIDFITNNADYRCVVELASLVHDTAVLNRYLPIYYNAFESELIKMIPILGSTQFETWYGAGGSMLYSIPGMLCDNPKDEPLCKYAYNAVLLQKNINHGISDIMPLINKNDSILDIKNELRVLRDSIYLVEGKIDRLVALKRYQDVEKRILLKTSINLKICHFEDIRGRLKKGEVCIEFFRFLTQNGLSYHYGALVLQFGHQYPIFVDLFDESELKPFVDLRSKSYSGEQSQLLYSQIWGQINEYLDGCNDVYYSPTGLLNLINMEALEDGNGVYAYAKYKLHRLSSTKEILTERRNEPFSSIVCFGGIDYAHQTNVKRIGLDSVDTRGGWSYLKNTMTEIEYIAEEGSRQNIIVDRYSGSSATESAFLSMNGSNKDIIHVATHGYYIPIGKRSGVRYFSNSPYTKFIQDNMFYSGLVLSGGTTAWSDSTYSVNSKDGILSSYEISHMDLYGTKLVVLSACETGFGDVLYDGVYGLQKAFKQAGAQSILMSLWEIDDAATADYMGCFYEFLLKGESIYDSYIKTIQYMRLKYQDPYYWASFILLD